MPPLAAPLCLPSLRLPVSHSFASRPPRSPALSCLRPLLPPALGLCWWPFLASPMLPVPCPLAATRPFPLAPVNPRLSPPLPASLCPPIHSPCPYIAFAIACFRFVAHFPPPRPPTPPPPVPPPFVLSAATLRLSPSLAFRSLTRRPLRSVRPSSTLAVPLSAPRRAPPSPPFAAGSAFSLPFLPLVPPFSSYHPFSALPAVRLPLFLSSKCVPLALAPPSHFLFASCWRPSFSLRSLPLIYRSPFVPLALIPSACPLCAARPDCHPSSPP